MLLLVFGCLTSVLILNCESDTDNPPAATGDCIDSDGDGYGEGSDCLGADCDDTDSNINAGAAEVCSNYLDDNCNGETDEGCSLCEEGLTDCGGSCVNIVTDVNHCGGCDRICNSPDHATAVCSDGVCGFVCNDGWYDYNGDPEDGCESSTP